MSMGVQHVVVPASLQTPPPAYISIDDALQRSIGEFGWGQRLIYLSASSALSAVGLQIMQFVFVGQDPVVEHQWHCLKPEDAACREAHQHSHPSVCNLNRTAWTWDNRGSNLISEWDLVCGRAWQAHVVNMLFFLGCAVGFYAFSQLAENTGRRRALFAACGMAAVCGLPAAAAPTLLWYAVFHSLVGVGVGGLAAVSPMLVIDTVGPSYRGLAALASHMFFALGACLTTLLSYLTTNWRLLTFVSSLLTAATSLAWTQLPESPRWLLRHGRKGEATAVLASIASYNHTRMPDLPLADVMPALKPLGEVLQHSRLRKRFAAMLLCWTVVSSGYYGLTVLLDHLQGALYTNTLLAFALELPVVLAVGFAVEHMGRRPPLQLLLAQGSALCLLCVIGNVTVRRILVLGARCCVVGSLVIVPLITAELFPASLRADVVSIIGTSSYVSPILGPGVVLLSLSVHLVWLPMLVVGVLLLAAAATTLLLPETKGAPMLDTAQDLGLQPPQLAAVAWRGNSFNWRRMFRPRTHSMSWGYRQMDSEDL